MHSSSAKTGGDQRVTDAEIESLFLLDAGRFSRSLERLGLARGPRLRVERLAIGSVAVTWLPLLVLAAIDGVGWGDAVQVPLLKDFLPYGQFLLAVPALILGELFVGKLLGWAAAELRRSEVLAAQDTPLLDAVLNRAVDLWRGWGVDTVIVVLTFVATGAWFWGVREWLTGGWQYRDGHLTPAGWWYVLVSLPVLRFLMLRWLWRLVLWAWLLWRVSGLKLQPKPMHPDRAGGLAFLGSTQAVFGVLLFTFSVQLSCGIADAVSYRGDRLMAFRWHVMAYVLIGVFILLLPLVVFAPKLVRARAENLLFLSGTAYRGASWLETQLRSDPADELSGRKISGLSDFGVLYENARFMKPLPLEWRHVLALGLAAVVPFLPLIFLVMPAQEVFQTLGKLIF